MKTHHDLILIVLLSFFLDRFSKQLVLLFPNQEIFIFGHPIIQFHRNYGIALGMPFNLNSIFWLAILILGLLAIYFKRKTILKSLNKKGIVGLGLIIGGAVGNIFDRLTLGCIIDFINIPFFNLIINFADVGILIGVGLVGLAVFCHPERNGFASRRRSGVKGSVKE